MVDSERRRTHVTPQPNPGAAPVAGGDEFVVAVNREVIVRARKRVTLALAGSGVNSLIVAAGVAAASIFLLIDSGPSNALFLGFAVALAANGGHTFHRLRRLRRTWRAQGVLEVAMRVSRAGLRLGIDAAPDSIFLPWHVVAGLHLGSMLGRVTLVVDLAPGVDASTPGTSGLGHPDVQRALRRPRWFRPYPLQYALRTLRQPVPVIDQALAYYSDGRVRVRAPSR